jgi:AraC-like DNA-binding protein
MILTTLPDLPPRPETAGNAEFRRRFYARWGKENAIVCGFAHAAEYAVHPQTLSLKLARGGRECYRLPQREIVLDDDNYLVLNEGERYGSVLRAAASPPAWSFAVFFAPGWLAQTAADRRRTLGAALDRPEPLEPTHAALRPSVGVREGLRRHGPSAVSTVLRRMERAVLDGERDQLPGAPWLDSACLALATALLDEEGHRDGALGHTRGARAAQRAELERRLAIARDFIESCHEQPLTLDTMAAVACLSRYHFVREFARCYGASPYAYLTAKRARAAMRALAAGATDLEAVAQQAGFGSRWSLRRALKMHSRKICTAAEQGTA